jgi:hypothetical protein
MLAREDQRLMAGSDFHGRLTIHRSSALVQRPTMLPSRAPGKRDCVTDSPLEACGAALGVSIY